MANGFQLNEEDNITLRNRPKSNKAGFSSNLIRWGLAKDQAQANLYLIGFVVVIFLIIIYQNRHSLF
jgi:hypothetical protein